jgi:hypothetical protein
MGTYTRTAKLIAGFALSFAMNGAELRKETLTAWDDYVAALKQQTAEQLHSDTRFLRIDETPETAALVHSGLIVVTPVGHNPKHVPHGLIHNWMGAAFIPNAGIDQVLAIIRDYDRYKEFYAPLVINSKSLGQDGDEYRFDMLMMNQALFAKGALDGEYAESFTRVSNTRWYSTAYSTRVQQIDNFGKPGQRTLPPDEGSGYLWRIYSVSKFEQRDGGVYVELEVIGLSRDIPVSLRWVVDPIVRRISRGSLTTSLEKTRAAVGSVAERRGRTTGGTVVASLPRGKAPARR